MKMKNKKIKRKLKMKTYSKNSKIKKWNEKLRIKNSSFPSHFTGGMQSGVSVIFVLDFNFRWDYFSTITFPKKSNGFH